MKIRWSYFFLVSSLFFASQASPYGAGVTSRCVTAGAIIILCWGLFVFDIKFLRSISLVQAKRVFQSNCLSVIFILLPLAARCRPGTFANLLLDTTVYCGAVFFIAFAAASRLEPLWGRLSCFHKTTVWIFLCSLIGYFIIVGAQLAASYYAYRIEWVDFSFEFAPVWQSCHYGLFRLINEFSQETTSLSGHLPLIYALISPLSLIWKSPTLVLWISTFFFAASAYTVYLLAKQYTKSQSISFLIASLYLLYLPVHLANLYDFHSDPLALPFIFLSFLFAQRQQWLFFAFSMGAALSCKEYVGLCYTGFGLWIFFRNKKAGAIIAMAGLLWFLFFLKSALGNVAPFVISANYGSVGGGQGIAGIAVFALSHPGLFAAKVARSSNIIAFISMFLPFLFLPFRKPWILLAGIFILLKDALSESGIELLSHRETLFFPFIVYALIMYTASIEGSKRRFQLCAIAVAVVITFMLQGHAFPSRGFWHMKEEYTQSAHDKVCDSILAKIPSEAAVMSSSHLSSHLLTRKWYFLFPRFPTPVEPDYVVVDTLEQADWNWLTRKEHQEGFWRMKNFNHYEIIQEKNGVFLFRRCR